LYVPWHIPDSVLIVLTGAGAIMAGVPPHADRATSEPRRYTAVALESPWEKFTASGARLIAVPPMAAASPLLDHGLRAGDASTRSPSASGGTRSNTKIAAIIRAMTKTEESTGCSTQFTA